MARQLQLALASLHPRRPVPGQTITDVSVTRMRVRPGDLDIYVHVNNGVYLQMMDVARSNLLADLGAFGRLRAAGWYPVVAAQTTTYRRSLQPFDRFEIRTRVLGWDERVVYLEQIFVRADEQVARAMVAGRFLARSGERIPAPQVAELLGADPTSPELPEDLRAWARSVDVAHRGG